MRLILPCEKWHVGPTPRGAVFELSTTPAALVKFFGAAPPGAPSMESVLGTLPPMLHDAELGLSCVLKTPEALEALAKVLLDTAAMCRMQQAREDKEREAARMEAEEKDKESGRLTAEEINALTEGK